MSEVPHEYHSSPCPIASGDDVPVVTQPEASSSPTTELGHSFQTRSSKARHEVLETNIQPDAKSPVDELRREMEDMGARIARLTLELEAVKKPGRDVGVPLLMLYSIFVGILAYCIARGSW